MKKGLKSGTLSADKSADCRGVNVIAVLQKKEKRKKKVKKIRRSGAALKKIS